jgi:hypothetical protein
MNTRPQITTHYADGTPSQTRDMTDEEISQLSSEPMLTHQPTDETPSDS